MREERIARAGKRYRIELICDGVPAVEAKEQRKRWTADR